MNNSINYDDIRNESEYSFEDITSEKYRHYKFSGEFSGVDVRIDDPVGLAVSDNGHRIVDAEGVCHYVGFHGFYLKWEPRSGQPHFVK